MLQPWPGTCGHGVTRSHDSRNACGVLCMRCAEALHITWTAVIWSWGNWSNTVWVAVLSKLINLLAQTNITRKDGPTRTAVISRRRALPGEFSAPHSFGPLVQGQVSRLQCGVVRLAGSIRLCHVLQSYYEPARFRRAERGQCNHRLISRPT